MTCTKALMPAAIACALFAGNAMAAEAELAPNAYSDNTVTFLGQVTDQTCEMTINGQAIRPVVLLPTVPRDVFQSESTAGETEFVVAVSGCRMGYPADDARAVIKYLGEGDAISTTFVAHEIEGPDLKNVILPDNGGAQNIHINIVDSRGVDIDFQQPFHGNGDLELKDTDGIGSASAIYTARYIAHDTYANLSAGYVRASMQYALSYD